MLKKLSEPEIKELLGVEFTWSQSRQSKGFGPASTTIELLTLEDGRIGNILIRATPLIVIHRTEWAARKAMQIVEKVLKAHGITETDMEARIFDDMLTVLEGKTVVGGQGFIGVTYQSLESLGLIQIKLTYEPDSDVTIRAPRV